MKSLFSLSPSPHIASHSSSSLLGANAQQPMQNGHEHTSSMAHQPLQGEQHSDTSNDHEHTDSTNSRPTETPSACSSSHVAHLVKKHFHTIHHHPLIKELKIRRKKHLEQILKCYFSWRDQVLKGDIDAMERNSVIQKRERLMDVVYSFYHYFNGQLVKMKPFKCKERVHKARLPAGQCDEAWRGYSAQEVMELGTDGLREEMADTVSMVSSSAHRSVQEKGSLEGTPQSTQRTSASQVSTVPSPVSSPSIPLNPSLSQSAGTNTSNGRKSFHDHGKHRHNPLKFHPHFNLSLSSKSKTKFIHCLWNILLIDLNWDFHQDVQRKVFLYYYRQMVDKNQRAQSSYEVPAIDFRAKDSFIPVVSFLVCALILCSDGDKKDSHLYSFDNSCLDLLHSILQHDLHMYGEFLSHENTLASLGSGLPTSHTPQRDIHYNILLMCHAVRRCIQEGELNSGEQLVCTKMRNANNSSVYTEYLSQMTHFPKFEEIMRIDGNRIKTNYHSLHLREILAPLCSVQELEGKYMQYDQGFEDVNLQSTPNGEFYPPNVRSRAHSVQNQYQRHDISDENPRHSLDLPVRPSASSNKQIPNSNNAHHSFRDSSSVSPHGPQQSSVTASMYDDSILSFDETDELSHSDSSSASEIDHVKVKIALYPTQKGLTFPRKKGKNKYPSIWLYYSSLIIGKWNLMWEPFSGLVVPSYVPFSRADDLPSPLIALDIAEFPKNDLPSLKKIISSICVKWNTNYVYGTEKGKKKQTEKKSIASPSSRGDLTDISIGIDSDHPAHEHDDCALDMHSPQYDGHQYHVGNCQNFVQDLLHYLNLNLVEDFQSDLDSPVVEYLHRLASSGKGSRTFYLTEDFRHHFKIYDIPSWASSWNQAILKPNILKFEEHKQLDYFLYFLQETDPFVAKHFPASWRLLKAFDRAFWIEYIHYHCAERDDGRQIHSEELRKTEPGYIEEENELVCPFLNPLDRSFCVTPVSSDKEDDFCEESESRSEMCMVGGHLPTVYPIEESLEPSIVRAFGM